MRNLKRALSLGLTAAMISGLMVMGSSAASYADVTSEDNVEAIDVLEAVGTMIGDENGNFNPDQNVTRNEMAAVMANLMEYNVASYRGTSPFTDVPSWAEPYVAACWTNGITAGYSDTIYGGSDTVTTAQAALMLMKALGYFQYASDFGGDWQLATTRQGNAIDLFVGVDSGVTQPMTRNDVAQLVLNTLRSGTVEANTDGNLTIGDITIANNVTYSYITSNADYADAIDDVKSTSNTTDANRFVVELGEQLYMGDLQLNDNTTDVFGRPARYWEYDGNEIGTYAKTELLRQSYTTEVTGRDLYDLLGSNVVDTYDLHVTIDGVTNDSINKNIFNISSINRNNKAAVGDTGNGVLTQVYLDLQEKDVYISIINTYLAIAADDYNERQEEVTLTVYGVNEVSDEYVKTVVDNQDDSESLEVSNDDFNVADVVEDDVMLVTLADGEVQSISDPETLAGVKITSFKQGDSLTADGTDYDYASAAEYDQETLEAYTNGTVINMKDMTYNVYLDQYGYVIGAVEVDEPNNYLFITGVDGNYNNLANATYEANAIFLDGTMATITIDGRKSDFIDDKNTDTTSDDESILMGDERDATVNRWFTYSVNSSDVYTVSLVDIDAGNDLGQSDEDRTKVIDYKNYSTTDGAGKLVYGNDNTVYLTASIDDIKTASGRTDVVIDDVDSVAVGIDNVDIQPWSMADVRADYPSANGELSYGVYTLYDEDGYIIAMVVVGEDNGNNDSLVYVHSGSLSRESWDETAEEWTWTRTAISGDTGEEITLTEVDDTRVSLLNNMIEDQWYRVRYNADGEVIAVRSSKDVSSLDYDKYTNFEDWDLKTPPYAYVTDFDTPANAINEAINATGVDTVLYHEGFVQDMLSNDGHTLYVSQNDDSGIRFTEDTAVVFEQMNNNKWETEFWSGESGVSRVIRALHDNTTTAADDADYEISVLMDNGRADTIIVLDKIKDGDSGTPGQGRDGELTYEATNFNGYGIVDYTVTAPEYAHRNARVTYTVNFLADGVVVGSATDTFNAVDGKDTGRWNRYIFSADAEITAELADISVDLTAVKYVNGDTKETLFVNSWNSSVTNSLLTVTNEAVYPAPGSNTVTFQVNTDDTARTLEYAVTGLTSDVNRGLFATDNKTPQTTAAVSAKGDQFVVVTIYGLDNLNEKWDVTFQSLSGSRLDAINAKVPSADASKTLTIEVDGASTDKIGVTNNTRYNTEVKLSAKPDGADAYQITIDKLGISGYVYDKHLSVTGEIVVNSDITLTAKDIVIKAVPQPTITNVVWTDNTITLYFDKAVDVAASALTKGTFADSTATLVDSTDTNVQSITYKVNKGILQAGDTLTIDNSKITGNVYDGTLNTNGDTTIELTANYGYTLK